MSNQPSPSPILCAAFNQDNRYFNTQFSNRILVHQMLNFVGSCFAIGTRDGYRIFDCNTGKLLYERAIGAFTVVEMLFSTSLLAVVGAGEQPSLSPRRLCLFNTVTGTSLRELNFLTSILAVRLNRKRLVVILLEKTYIYDINNLKILDAIDTVPNSKGLCAFSPSPDGSFLALPASITKGSVLVYNVMELQSHCEIDAHRSPLAAMVLSFDGMYIATASEQGTIIRIHLISEGTKSYSFRRGAYASNIYSLSFSPSTDLPDILLATSSSGSTHVFSLRLALNHRSRRSNTILGSIVPNSITEVLDPAHHHVLHQVVPAGVKSNAVIRNLEMVHDKSVSANGMIRATISMISYGGYFLEYGCCINQQNEVSWTLEREFNLLTGQVETSIGSSIGD